MPVLTKKIGTLFTHCGLSIIETDIGVKEVVYFDGVCKLCNWAVRFLIKHDKKTRFFFAPLQSDYARKSLGYSNGHHTSLESLVFQDHTLILTKSDAVLKIMGGLGGYWKLLTVFKVLPKSWRDSLYEFIAGNRYRWFGKSNKCLIPTKEISSRFLA